MKLYGSVYIYIYNYILIYDYNIHIIYIYTVIYIYFCGRSTRTELSSVATCCSSARQTWIHQDDGKMHQNAPKTLSDGKKPWKKHCISLVQVGHSYSFAILNKFVFFELFLHFENFGNFGDFGIFSNRCGHVGNFWSFFHFCQFWAILAALADIFGRFGSLDDFGWILPLLDILASWPRWQFGANLAIWNKQMISISHAIILWMVAKSCTTWDGRTPINTLW